MKNLIFLLLFAPMIGLAAQNNSGIDAISSALSAGDVEALSKYFADNVEISIDDKEQIYPKAKAADTMRGFFGANKPKNFSSTHKGQSRENSDQYCIGTLNTASGNYRVYIYLKVSGSNLSIQEMRIDKA
jgi:Domain of unknown function (DUF4783)